MQLFSRDVNFLFPHHVQTCRTCTGVKSVRCWIYFHSAALTGCWLHPQTASSSRLCACRLTHWNTQSWFTHLSMSGVLCNRQALSLSLLRLQQRLCNKLKSIFLKLPVWGFFYMCLCLLMCLCFCLWGTRRPAAILLRAWVSSGYSHFHQHITLAVRWIEDSKLSTAVVCLCQPFDWRVTSPGWLRLSPTS